MNRRSAGTKARLIAEAVELYEEARAWEPLGELSERLGIERVIAIVTPGNERSVALLAKLGPDRARGFAFSIVLPTDASGKELRRATPGIQSAAQVRQLVAN